MNFFAYYFVNIFKEFFTHIGAIEFTGISTDSRKIEEGQLFVTLDGDNFSGADFIKEAIDKGAAGIVCKKEDIANLSIDHSVSLILTEDPLDMYQKIAFEYLKMKKTTLVIAITGSAGKTSVKEWLYQILVQRFTVYKNEGNINNLIGVPQSIFEIQKEDIAILELGAGKFGDIEKLASLIYPAIGIITNIGPAHLEFFGSLEAIAKEKSKLMDYADRTFVPHNIFRKEEYYDLGYDINPANIFDSVMEKGLDGYEITYKGHTFDFPFFGDHNIQNLAIVLYVCTLIGLTPDIIGQIQFEPLPSHRNELITIDQTRLLLDCYNANPLSMEKTIMALTPLHPKITLILGDMLELGDSAEMFHTELGKMISELPNIHHVHFVGQLMENAFKAYTKENKTHYVNVEDLKDAMNAIDTSEDQIIFVKGSRGIHLEAVQFYF